jgi:hypothetical protein
MTAHEYVATAIHEVMEGRGPIFLEETDEIAAEEMARAIDELAEDWRIDVDYEVQSYRVALLTAGRRPDTRYDEYE